MTTARSQQVVSGPAGGGDAPGLAGLLGFAAAPVFALMALWTAASGTPDMLCTSMGGSPLGGMTLMYLLMAAFHLAPWLRWLARR